MVKHIAGELAALVAFAVVGWLGYEPLCRFASMAAAKGNVSSVLALTIDAGVLILLLAKIPDSVRALVQGSGCAGKETRE
jgi:Ni/Fe-hydrogenase subunit HybB-like protein